MRWFGSVAGDIACLGEEPHLVAPLLVLLSLFVYRIIVVDQVNVFDVLIEGR